MKPIHRFALASVIALFISACSQPAGLPKAELEPQYGTAKEDSAYYVATNEKGSVYTLGLEQSSRPAYSKAVVTRFNRKGDRLWTRKIDFSCTATLSDRCALMPVELELDSTGNAYVYIYTWKEADDTSFGNSHLYKYSPTGVLLWQRTVSRMAAEDSYVGFGDFGMGVNAQGQSYVAFVQDDRNSATFATKRLRKYAANGALLWDVPIAAISPSDVAVSSSGNVYVSGEGGLAKYGAGGAQIWQRAFDPLLHHSVRLALSGANTIYLHGTAILDVDGTANYQAVSLIYKYDAGGKLLWQRDLVRPGGISGLAADSLGNAYVTGGYFTKGGDVDLYVSKVSPSGQLVWHYAPRLPSTREQGYGVAAFSSELYVVGETDSKVNGKNFGNTDAFLMRLDGQGKRVWSR